MTILSQKGNPSSMSFDYSIPEQKAPGGLQMSKKLIPTGQFTKLLVISVMLKLEFIRKIVGLPCSRHIVALIGRPGTGKSYHSQRIASDFNLDFIIDDGLLINQNGIVAGRSAKNELTRIAATKIAIFNDKEHAFSVKESIRKSQAKRILVVGTSLKMVDRITVQLCLGKIQKVIRIEDIVTSENIRIAQIQRQKLGRHIIPVAAMEVRNKYSAIFFTSVQTKLKYFVGKKSNIPQNFENSIVRPKFGQPYRITISEKVIHQIISDSILHISRDVNIRTIKIKWIRSDACRINLLLDIYHSTNLSNITLNIAKHVKMFLEQNTGLVVDMVDINICSYNSKISKSDNYSHTV